MEICKLKLQYFYCMYNYILFLKDQKFLEMKKVGFNVEDFMFCGVLLDIEVDVDEDFKNQFENYRYRFFVYI